MRVALIGLSLAGCVAKNGCEDGVTAGGSQAGTNTRKCGCEERVAAAAAQARADAPDCTFAPEDLKHLTCGGTDQSPELTYYAVWCGLAELSCIREDPVLDELCFGGA